jgi:ABC-type lipoprotein release transport system permease subunit
MAKKSAKSVTSVRKNKSELIIVILASSCVLLALGVALLYQQKELINEENYSLEQQYVDQNSQVQYMQQKMKTMEADTTTAQNK